MKHLIWGLAAVTLGATLSSAGSISYSGYTGEDVSSGRDTQFVITNNTICNNNGSPGTCTGGLEGGSGSPSFDSYLLTSASVTADTYATLNLPSPLSGTASWVGPQANQDTGTTGGPINGSTCCDGTTTYTVTFNLTGFNLADPVTMALMLGADDTASVTLNGHAISLGGSPTYNSILTTNNITVTSDSLTATGDTLVFVVNNSGGGPTGLDAYFGLTGTAAVPEPATFALTGLGLAAFGFFRSRKNS